MSKYIKPPKSEDCTWRSGPPPGIGWWPAGVTLDPDVLRYWDGDCWSFCVRSYESARAAALQASIKLQITNGHIIWTDRWW